MSFVKLPLGAVVKMLDHPKILVSFLATDRFKVVGNPGPGMPGDFEKGLGTYEIECVTDGPNRGKRVMRHMLDVTPADRASVIEGLKKQIADAKAELQELSAKIENAKTDFKDSFGDDENKLAEALAKELGVVDRAAVVKALRKVMDIKYY